MTPPMTPDDFFAKFALEFLKQVSGNVVNGVSKRIGDLFARHRNAPPPPANEVHTPFNTRPPLPLTLTKLFGREADFASIIKLLLEHRLVTLTGPGGVGKTTLAQTVALWAWDEEQQAKNKSPRGVPYVALDALSSGRDLADTVRTRLVPDSPPPATDDRALRRDDAVRVIASALSQHARMLVLDNFENALDEAGAEEACQFLSDLILQTDERVSFLVTCRRPLPITRFGEAYEVEPLDLQDAIDLFYDRARIERTAERDASVTTICVAVDRLPFGVELAALAVRQGHRPLKEVVEGLRVTLLDVEAADALDYPPRQRGLIASFRYTFEHLPIEARRLFCAFSVFRGGAERDAVKAVDGTDAWERALNALVDWRLLIRAERGDTYRYTLLATTEAFARWALKQYGAELGVDVRAVAERHARHYATVAARFDQTPMERWREIEVDWENLRAGADWAAGELEAREGATVDELLARLDTLPTDAKDAGLAGEYAHHLGKFVYWRRVADGRRWFGAGLIAFHCTGDKKHEAEMYNELGLWFDVRGDYDGALAQYEQSAKLLADLGDRMWLAVAYNNIGLIHRARGEYDAALGWYERSVALSEEIGNKAGLATTYNNIGLIHDARGEYDAALGWYERSVTLKEELGHKAGLATTYNNIGEIHRARGEYDAALGWYEKSVTTFRAIGDEPSLATLQSNLAVLALVMDDHAQAQAYAQESLRLYERLKLEKDAARVRAWMAEEGLSTDL